MSACLCKTHFREVANYFDKNVALAYELDEANCVICNHVIFVESARRFVEQQQHHNGSDAALRLPDPYAHSGS